MKVIGSILLCCFMMPVKAQIIKGKIISQTQAIAYATIGVKGKAIGTVSDLQGDFSLDLKGEKLEDNTSVIVSCIGYQTKELKLQDFLKEEALLR